MIYHSEFQLDEEKREIFPGYSPDLPYVCMDVVLDSVSGRGWHWHPELEADYILEGSLCLRTMENVITLHEGDVVFVNANVLHDAHAAGSRGICRIIAHVFDSSFLGGMYGSRIEDKYIIPVKNCAALPAYFFSQDSPEHRQMAGYLKEAAERAGGEDYGFEFEIRSLLAKFWCKLLQDTEQIRENTAPAGNPQSERIKRMLEYIRNHYSENITVEQVADAAHVSTRECTRCFHQVIGEPPLSYLNQYRLRIAAKMLSEQETSVLEISEACGFSSGSYFARKFNALMGCTPLKYRQRSHMQPEINDIGGRRDL